MDFYRTYRRALKVTKLALRRPYSGLLWLVRAATQPMIIRYHGLSLKLAHGDPGKICKSEVLLVTHVHDEFSRMPFFFDHYRKLGVDRFLIVASNATDSFVEYARQRDDCCAWRTSANYRRSRRGTWWRNHLLRRFGVGHLCVVVDPDEYLVYPYMATRSVRALGQFLKDDHRECAHALLVDAYGEHAPAETVYRPGDNPFEICAYFDRDGYTQRSGPLKTTFVQGGPLMRVRFKDNPAGAPPLDTVPIVWWKKNYRYQRANHFLDPPYLNLAHRPGEVSLSCCLFRFEFLAPSTDAAKPGAKPEDDIRKDGNEAALYQDGVSAKYEGPQQLIDLGLMRRRLGVIEAWAEKAGGRRAIE